MIVLTQDHHLIIPGHFSSLASQRYKAYHFVGTFYKEAVDDEPGRKTGRRASVSRTDRGHNQDGKIVPLLHIDSFLFYSLYKLSPHALEHD